MWYCQSTKVKATLWSVDLTEESIVGTCYESRRKDF